jgi:23S rRNA (guanosine2251-2'-O)-methyltransferase
MARRAPAGRPATGPAGRPAADGRLPALGDLRWGTHAVEEALRAGRVRQVLVQSDLRHRPRLDGIVRQAEQAGITVRPVARSELDTLAGGQRHQGVVAVVAPYPYRSLHDLLAEQRAEPPLLLALDGVEDPQNLGAILRSADAAGVHGVVLPAVARASAGAADYLAIAQVVNLRRALKTMKEAGIWVYGLDAHGTTDFDTADYDRPVAIVAGAEGKGLSRLVREACDLLVRIPMYGHVASLNVSVATALALFAARRARGRARARP